MFAALLAYHLLFVNALLYVREGVLSLSDSISWDLCGQHSSSVLLCVLLAVLVLRSDPSLEVPVMLSLVLLGREDVVITYI